MLIGKGKFHSTAAFSLWTAERGPVRLRLARRLPGTSAPSLTEKMDWEDSTLYAVALVSLVALDVAVTSLATVDVEEPVSFL
jgi:hypothetical protein